MIERVETPRLIATPIGPADFDELMSLHRDPAVMATLGGRLWDERDNRGFLERMTDHWDRYGYGVWSVREREDGRFVGRAGLNHKRIDGVDEVELLYAYRSDCWGLGIATECALAMVAAAFERLKLSSLIAITLPTNVASRRVMEKAGFRYERDTIHASLPHVLYQRRTSVIL